VSRLAAALFSGAPVPPELLDLGIDATTLAPDRPALAAASEFGP
jgi:hypothetical protein